MSAARTHPKNDLRYTISQQDDFYITLRLFGLSERSSVIVERRVSLSFKIYSGILAVAACILALSNLSSILVPNDIIPPMFAGSSSIVQRSVYPLWCTMCAILRVCVSYTTLSKKFARDLERASADIQREPGLAKLWVPARKHVLVRNVVSGVGFSFFIVVNMSMFVMLSERTILELVTCPQMYLRLLETLIFCSSFLGTSVFLGITSISHLTRMFLWVDSEVEEWSRGAQKSAEALKGIMGRHNLCWQLTDVYNGPFRAALGTAFIFCVPIFCLVTTQFVKIYNERDGTGKTLPLVAFLLLWSASCISFTSTMCVFSSSINSAAAAPRKHLMKLTEGHDIQILHFLSRLNEYKIGFSFFDFFVIEKTTLLSIFSLMVTYLVVFLQMAQADTLSSQSSK